MSHWIENAVLYLAQAVSMRDLSISRQFGRC